MLEKVLVLVLLGSLVLQIRTNRRLTREIDIVRDIARYTARQVNVIDSWIRVINARTETLWELQENVQPDESEVESTNEHQP